MNHKSFSSIERTLAFIAGFLDLLIGIAFYFLPELHFPIWPTSVPAILARFIGAIVIGNGVGALWLSTERTWDRVRPLAIVATVYGTLVGLALLYHLLYLQAAPIFWVYFASDIPFLLVFYVLFFYHDIIPSLSRRKGTRSYPEKV